MNVKVWGLCLAVVVVGCEVTTLVPQLHPRTNQAPPRTSSIHASMETEIWEQINTIRQKNQLKPLRQNDQLAHVAREYSQKMAREDFFSHTSPDGTTPAQRVRDGGIFYIVVGENLFRSSNISNPVPSAVQGWMESPGHRQNILHAVFTETGIGVWREGNRYYITQLFLRSLF